MFFNLFNILYTAIILFTAQSSFSSDFAFFHNSRRALSQASFAMLLSFFLNRYSCLFDFGDGKLFLFLLTWRGFMI